MVSAILGGVFDPFHNQHIQIALDSREKYNLDKIVFVPAKTPPHKDSPKASGEQRLYMLKLALNSFPEFVISDCELKRPGISYTIDTIEFLKPDYLILGADAYSILDTWHNIDKIKKMVEFIVVPRIVRLSSSSIRSKLEKGESISGLVPIAVEKYIIENRLYS